MVQSNYQNIGGFSMKKNKYLTLISLSAFSIVSISTFGLGTLNAAETSNSPVIKHLDFNPNDDSYLKGFGSLVLDNGLNFNPLKRISATDSVDGNLTSQIKVAGSIDTTKPGLYELTYSVINSRNFDTTLKVPVRVAPSSKANRRDTPPVISGIYSEVINKGDWGFSFLDTARAYDAEDGDLTSKIVFEGVDKIEVDFPGHEFPIKVSVTDSYGNTSSQTIFISIATPNN